MEGQICSPPRAWHNSGSPGQLGLKNVNYVCFEIFVQKHFFTLVIWGFFAFTSCALTYCLCFNLFYILYFLHCLCFYFLFFLFYHNFIFLMQIFTIVSSVTFFISTDIFALFSMPESAATLLGTFATHVIRTILLWVTLRISTKAFFFSLISYSVDLFLSIPTALITILNRGSCTSMVSLWQVTCDKRRRKNVLNKKMYKKIHFFLQIQ